MANLYRSYLSFYQLRPDNSLHYKKNDNKVSLNFNFQGRKIGSKVPWILKTGRVNYRVVESNQMIVITLKVWNKIKVWEYNNNNNNSRKKNGLIKEFTDQSSQQKQNRRKTAKLQGDENQKSWMKIIRPYSALRKLQLTTPLKTLWPAKIIFHYYSAVLKFLS